MKLTYLLFFCSLLFDPMRCLGTAPAEGLPLFYWNEDPFENFGDVISLKLVERIVGSPLRTYVKKNIKQDKKLLAVGSILYFANENDVVWGSGTNGKRPNKKDYNFKYLDIRAIRGPLARDFLKTNFDIDAPEIYGDPALLFPYLFPEYKKKKNPSREYIVIPHYKERHLFPRGENLNTHVVYPSDPWEKVIEKILDSKFVIASAMHGLILAEAYGIPARMLRVTTIEPMIKYEDYYASTNRPDFRYAESVEDALVMGGEAPFECDLKTLYEAFPFEFWPNAEFRHPDFSSKEF